MGMYDHIKIIFWQTSNTQKVVVEMANAAQNSGSGRAVFILTGRPSRR